MQQFRKKYKTTNQCVSVFAASSHISVPNSVDVLKLIIPLIFVPILLKDFYTVTKLFGIFYVFHHLLKLKFRSPSQLLSLLLFSVSNLCWGSKSIIYEAAQFNTYQKRLTFLCKFIVLEI